MLPEPPDLGTTIPTWKSNELFWIVKSGLKYTGMPAWPAQERDDEVWAMVAFLQRLPKMNAVQYREMTSTAPREQDVPIQMLAKGGPVGRGLAACSRCHGLDGAAVASGAFPRIDIQTTTYLLAQLQDYAAGKRKSGIMQPVAAELEAAEMRQLADYYAAQQPANPIVTATGDDGVVALGQRLATVGLPDLGIPACNACHAQGVSPLYPALAGQYANYTSQQLELFKSGVRDTPAAAIMSVIARRLTSGQIAAVSVYFARLPPPATEGTTP
jgi:cytochrome c553